MQPCHHTDHSEKQREEADHSEKQREEALHRPRTAGLRDTGRRLALTHSDSDNYSRQRFLTAGLPIGAQRSGPPYLTRRGQDTCPHTTDYCCRRGRQYHRVIENVLHSMCKRYIKRLAENENITTNKDD